jgi:hypothetical protein
MEYFRKYLALFLSLLIFGESIACYWSPSMNYEMFFDRHLLFENGKKNQFYTAWLHNESLYNDDVVVNENASTWAVYLENTYTLENLKSFIYRENPKSFKDPLKELKALQLKRKKAGGDLLKEKQFVDFIGFALKVEAFLEEITPDPWEEEPKPLNPSLFTPLINVAKTQISRITTNELLRERYAYQLLKLYRYSEQYTNAAQTFENYFKNSSSNFSYYAMDQYAGVLAKLGRTAESNYYFSKVYVNCPSKRESTYLSLKIRNRNDLNSALSLCRITEEKMALYYIHAMHSKSLALENLKMIFNELGDNEFSRMIMSKEINKLEKILLTRYHENEGEDQESNPQNRLSETQAKAYLKDLLSFNEQVLANGESDAYWQLSLAYLYFLDGNHVKCFESLSSIPENDALIKDQKQIIYVVNLIVSKPELSTYDENKIGQMLFELNRNKTSYPLMTKDNNSLDNNYGDESFEYNTAIEFIFSMMHKRHENNNSYLSLIFSGNTIQNSIYLEYRDDSNYKGQGISVSYIDKLLSDQLNCNETKLALFASNYFFTKRYYNDEGMLVSKNQITDFEDCKVELTELKATLLMRNPATLSQAVNLLKTLPAENMNEYAFHGNPFELRLKASTFEKFEEIELRLPKQTRLSFAEKLLALYNDKNTNDNLLKLAFAYYNSSYYGLNWKAMAYFRAYSSPNANCDMRRTKALFNEALSNGTLTSEQQAMAHYMIALCDQHRYTLERNEEIPSNDSWDNENGFDNYFSTMIQNNVFNSFESLQKYANTKVYQDIVKECNYFRYYLN